MAISNRTKKRLLILTSIVVVLFSAVGITYVVREGQLDRKALTALDDGMDAYNQEDYETALHGIGTYLQRHGEEADADTLYAYADARLNVPVPNDRHITQGIALLERVLEKDPNHEQTIEALLKLRLAVGQTMEALNLAERVLADAPDNQLANETRIFAYQRSGDIDNAVRAAKDYFQQRSDDVEIARLLIGLMLNDPVQRLSLQKPEGLLLTIRESHGQSPKFLLLLSQAYRTLENNEQARELLTQLVDMPAADDETATQIALELMRSETEGFDRGFAYISKVIAERDSDRLRVWSAERKFQLGQFNDARSLAEQVAKVSDSYVQAQALLVLMAWEQGDKETALPHIESIRNNDSALAKAWVAVFEATILEENAKAEDARPILLDALKTDPSNRYFNFALAIAYRDLGELELAAQYLSPVVQAEPTWWSAGLELCSIFENLGYYSSAKKLLDNLIKLHPQVAAVRIRWAVITSLRISPSDPQTARVSLERIDGFMEEVLAEFPEADDTLALARARCMGILSLTEQQDRQSNRVITLGLQELIGELSTATSDPAVIQACSQFNERFSLGLDGVLGQSENGDSLTIATNEAELLAFQGDAAAGLLHLQTAIELSELSTTEQDFLRVQYMERFNLPGALSVWKTLLDNSPDNLILLRAAARSTAVLSSESLGSSVVNRLKAKTGEEGYAWRFAEVRHAALLADSDSDRVAVADRLGAMIRGGYAKAEARILLADLLLALKNPRGAMNQLTSAVEENPGNATANMALLQLAINQERYDVARSAVSRLALAEQLAPGIASEIARLADSLGERGAATALRSRRGVEDYLQPAERLAQLRQFLITGNTAQANEIQAELLVSNDVNVLKQLAILLSLRGGAAEAQPAIDALIACPGSDALLVASTKAVVAELAGDFTEALRLLEEASGSTSELLRDVDLATQYFRLLFQREDGLVNVVAALRQAGANESSNQDAVLNASVFYCFEQASTNQDARQGMLQALGLEAMRSDDPRIFKNAASLMVQDPWSPVTGPNPSLFAGLDQLRKSNPDEVSLYNLLTTLYLMSGQSAKAITLAQQTRVRFENDPISASLLAQAYANTNQWRLVLGVTQIWRQLASPTRENLNTINLLTATALIEIGDWQAAELVLGEIGEAGDRAKALLIRTYIRSGRLDAARNEFAGLLELDSSRWRVTMVQFALTDVLEVDPRVAGQWLDDLSDIIPVDELGERLLWAQAMFVVGQRQDNTTRLNISYTAMRSLSREPDFPPSGWLLIGVYHEMRDEFTEAAEAYNQALALDSGQHQAANNLANILIIQGDLDNARLLSEQAVTITSGQPRASYLDTLAQIERETGNIDAALDLLANVIQIERDNPKWYIRRASILVDAEKFDEARDCIRRMHQWAGDVSADEPEIQRQLDNVMEQLG